MVSRVSLIDSRRPRLRFMASWSRYKPRTARTVPKNRLNKISLVTVVSLTSRSTLGVFEPDQVGIEGTWRMLGELGWAWAGMGQFGRN